MSRSERCRFCGRPATSPALAYSLFQVLGIGKTNGFLSPKGNDGIIHFAQGLDETVFLVRLRSTLVVHEAVDELRLPQKLHDHRILRIQFGGLLGHDLGLVVIAAGPCNLLNSSISRASFSLDFDFGPLLAARLLGERGGSCSANSICGRLLLDELLGFANGTIDAPQQLIASDLSKPAASTFFRASSNWASDPLGSRVAQGAGVGFCVGQFRGDLPDQHLLAGGRFVGQRRPAAGCCGPCAKAPTASADGLANVGP